MPPEVVNDRYVRLRCRDERGNELSKSIRLRFKPQNDQVGVFWEGTTVGWFAFDEMIQAVEFAREDGQEDAIQGRN